MKLCGGIISLCGIGIRYSVTLGSAFLTSSHWLCLSICLWLFSIFLRRKWKKWKSQFCITRHAAPLPRLWIAGGITWWTRLSGTISDSLNPSQHNSPEPCEPKQNMLKKFIYIACTPWVRHINRSQAQWIEAQNKKPAAAWYSMHLLLFCWDKTHLSQAGEIFLHPWILTHPGVYELDGKRSSVQSSPTIAVAGDEFSFA